MTMRFLGRAALPALQCSRSSPSRSRPAPARQRPALPAARHQGVYVTGVSSGGFMATQLQVAYSGTFDGAGVFAAGPYDCGQGNVIDLPPATWAPACRPGAAGCDLVGRGADRPGQQPGGQADLRLPRNPRPGRRMIGLGLRRGLLPALRRERGVPRPGSGRPWLAHPDGVVPCSLTSPPFLINCGDDPEGEMLTHWLGSVNPPNTGTPDGTLSSSTRTCTHPAATRRRWAWTTAAWSNPAGLRRGAPASWSSRCTAALAGSTCWATVPRPGQSRYLRRHQ